jgi:hypothetical protein
MPRVTPFALAVALLLPLSGHAQEYGLRSLAFQGARGSVYQVVPARSESTVGVQLAAHLGNLAPRVRLVPSVTVWATDFREQEINQIRLRVEAECEAAGTPCPDLTFGGVQLSDFSLDIDAHYLFRGPFNTRPYAGAGAGLHLVNGGGELIDNTFVEEILDAITPGINSVAGIEVPLFRGLRLHGEVRGVLAGGANWIGAGIGGSLILPTRRARAPETPR